MTFNSATSTTFFYRTFFNLLWKIIIQQETLSLQRFRSMKKKWNYLFEKSTANPTARRKYKKTMFYVFSIFFIKTNLEATFGWKCLAYSNNSIVKCLAWFLFHINVSVLIHTVKLQQLVSISNFRAIRLTLGLLFRDKYLLEIYPVYRCPCNFVETKLSCLHKNYFSVV